MSSADAMWHVERVHPRRGSGPPAKVASPHLLTAFHAGVVLYYVVMDVLMSVVSMKLYEVGHPVTKMFLGGLTQFFTTWNQVFQQTYFALSLAEDILGYSTSKSHALTRQSIAAFKRRLFGPILLPSCCLTLINFWGIYALVPHLMLDDLVAFYPAFLNHVMHTFIVPLALLELLATPHRHVSRATGFHDVTVLMAAYAGWIYFLGWLLGQWPYPFLAVMSVRHHIVFIPCMFLHGYFWYFVTDTLMRKIWGNHSEEEEELKKD